MPRSIRNGLLGAAAVTLLLAACGASESAAPVFVEPILPPAQLELKVEVQPTAEVEPDPPLTERWRAPFAVSSSGRIAVREPRPVVVLGADTAVERRAAESGPPPAVAAGADDDPPSAAFPGSGLRMHQVGPGETLWGIARHYDVAPEEILEVNRLLDDRIRLGQTLVIPPPGDDQ